MALDYNLDKVPANKIYRSEYACDDQWVKGFLSQVTLGHIGTRWDEQPFVTPVMFCYDPQRHEIYFHSNIVGRMQANCERHELVCFEASREGKLLPSNVALEFSVQYESVVAFGQVRLLRSDEEKKHALYGLVEKYFPRMKPGEHYRPIMDVELRRTAVYALTIESWSGKRNWPERAEQSTDWKQLGEEWFE
jgi:nitroimidazol reductase NimA-like FMN-containing flavoprotein (pyridoxamine 5'-phosphate oxidase superfamily)